MSELSYLKVFLDWRTATCKLSYEEQGRLINAMIAYASDEENADSLLTGDEAILFPVFKLQIDRDKAEIRKKKESNAENGKKGGAPKGNQNARKQPKTTENNPKQSKQPKQPKTKTTDNDEGLLTIDKDDSSPPIPPAGETGEAVSAADAEFDRFWAEYPRKTGKGTARDAFKKARKKTTLEVMLSAVSRQKTSWDWTKDGGQFIPYPATWLNQERWNDELNAYQGGGYGRNNSYGGGFRNEPRKELPTDGFKIIE